MKWFWRHRRVWFGLLTVGLIVCISLAMAIRPLLRRQLQGMVSAQLNAHLELGRLSYSFPYGITVDDASLVAAGPDGRDVHLLKMRRLELKLAELPFGGGPLVIESLIIDEPSVHLIMTEDGLVGEKTLIRSDPQVQRRWKLSEMFQLRRVALRGGQVVYEDRARPETVPLVWKNLEIDLHTAPQSGALYAYNLVANNAPLAKLEANGTAEIDQLLLAVHQCGLSVLVDPQQQYSALPGELQALLRDSNVRGRLNLDARARVPLRDIGSCAYDMTVELVNASAAPASWPTPVDHVALKVQCRAGELDLPESTAPATVAQLKLFHFDAAAGGATLALVDALAMVDPVARRWALQSLRGQIIADGDDASGTSAEREVAGMTLAGGVAFAVDAEGPMQVESMLDLRGQLHLTPQALRVRPPTFVDSLRQIDPLSISLHNGQLVIENLQLAIGQDLLQIHRAVVALNDAPPLVSFGELVGMVQLRGPRPGYPQTVLEALKHLNPWGTYTFVANGAIDLDQPVPAIEGTVELLSRGGHIELTDRAIPLSEPRIELSFRGNEVKVAAFEAHLLDGIARGSGRLVLDKPMQYELDARLDRVDLKQFAQLYSNDAEDPLPLSGRGYLRLRGRACRCATSEAARMT